ncbi:hypothetical protein FRB98_008986 [Tulasnella sp. 332]|nr:hypothetical protein FRB98_008986 [Tulasnella sp. 332]
MDTTPKDGAKSDPIEDIRNLTTEIRELLRKQVLGEDDFWSRYDMAADVYDKAQLHRQNDNLDVLLIFAGLFSAVNTAFIVLTIVNLSAPPSYKMEQLLTFLVNRTDPTTLSAEDFNPSFVPHTAAIRQNCLFFASLCSSILAAAGAVLGKQWLRKYERTGQVGSHEAQGRIRTEKWYGSEEWGLRAVIEVLPNLLLVSVGLFFAAVADYLWATRKPVAVVVLVFIVVGVLLYAIMVISAAIDKDCPFQTAPSGLLREGIKEMREFSSRNLETEAPEKDSRALRFRRVLEWLPNHLHHDSPRPQDEIADTTPPTHTPLRSRLTSNARSLYAWVIELLPSRRSHAPHVDLESTALSETVGEPAAPAQPEEIEAPAQPEESQEKVAVEAVGDEGAHVEKSSPWAWLKKKVFKGAEGAAASPDEQDKAKGEDPAALPRGSSQTIDLTDMWKEFGAGMTDEEKLFQKTALIDEKISARSIVWMMENATNKTDLLSAADMIPSLTRREATELMAGQKAMTRLIDLFQSSLTVVVDSNATDADDALIFGRAVAHVLLADPASCLETVREALLESQVRSLWTSYWKAQLIQPSLQALCAGMFAMTSENDTVESFPAAAAAAAFEEMQRGKVEPTTVVAFSGLLTLSRFGLSGAILEYGIPHSDALFSLVCLEIIERTNGQRSSLADRTPGEASTTPSRRWDQLRLITWEDRVKEDPPVPADTLPGEIRAYARQLELLLGDGTEWWLKAAESEVFIDTVKTEANSATVDQMLKEPTFPLADLKKNYSIIPLSSLTPFIEHALGCDVPVVLAATYKLLNAVGEGAWDIASGPRLGRPLVVTPKLGCAVISSLSINARKMDMFYFATSNQFDLEGLLYWLAESVKEDKGLGEAFSSSGAASLFVSTIRNTYKASGGDNNYVWCIAFLFLRTWTTSSDQQKDPAPAEGAREGDTSLQEVCVAFKEYALGTMVRLQNFRTNPDLFRHSATFIEEVYRLRPYLAVGLELDDVRDKLMGASAGWWGETEVIPPNWDAAAKPVPRVVATITEADTEEKWIRTKEINLFLDIAIKYKAESVAMTKAVELSLTNPNFPLVGLLKSDANQPPSSLVLVLICALKSKVFTVFDAAYQLIGELGLRAGSRYRGPRDGKPFVINVELGRSVMQSLSANVVAKAPGFSIVSYAGEHEDNLVGLLYWLSESARHAPELATPIGTSGVTSLFVEGISGAGRKGWASTSSLEDRVMWHLVFLYLSMWAASETRSTGGSAEKTPSLQPYQDGAMSDAVCRTLAWYIHEHMTHTLNDYYPDDQDVLRKTFAFIEQVFLTRPVAGLKFGLDAACEELIRFAAGWNEGLGMDACWKKARNAYPWAGQAHSMDVCQWARLGGLKRTCMISSPLMS